MRAWLASGVHGDVYRIPAGVVKVMRDLRAGRHEAEIHRRLAGLGDRRFCVMTDYVECDGEAALVFPFVAGKTVRDWIEEGDEEEVDRRLPLILEEVLGAMAGGAAIGYVHGDLHVANVMVEGPTIIDQTLASVRGVALYGEGDPYMDLFKLFASAYKTVQRRWELCGELYRSLMMLRYALNALFSPESEPLFCSTYLHYDTANVTFMADPYFAELDGYDAAATRAVRRRDPTYEFARRIIREYQNEF